jgi:hypothetical protein
MEKSGLMLLFAPQCIQNAKNAAWLGRRVVVDLPEAI